MAFKLARYLVALFCGIGERGRVLGGRPVSLCELLEGGIVPLLIQRPHRLDAHGAGVHGIEDIMFVTDGIIFVHDVLCHILIADGIGEGSFDMLLHRILRLIDQRLDSLVVVIELNAGVEEHVVIDLIGEGIHTGAMELGESSAETCRREFYEETGITVEPLRLLNVYTNFEETYPNGDKVQTVVMLYEVIAKTDKAITDYQNDETLRLGYFSREEIAELSSISDKHRLMLAEYFADEFQMGH